MPAQDMVRPEAAEIGVEALRSLFVTVDSPYPPSSGAPLRNWQNVSLAAELGPTAVLSIGHECPPSRCLPNVERWEHVVVPRYSAAAPRGYPFVGGDAGAAARVRLYALVRSFSPSTVVFENFRLEGGADAVRRRGRRVVFDSHNAYVSLAAELGLGGPHVEAQERAALDEADEVWVCSVDDAERLRAAYGPRAALRVIPNGIDVASYAVVRERAARRAAHRAPGLLFVGAFWYEPNRIAAEELAGEILPRVRRQLDDGVRLYLVGAAPSAAMLAAAQHDPRIVVTGRVPDVRPYLALADVIAVPLRQGGGTRLKLLEAFAAERAVVATAKAVEGLPVRDGEHLLLRESDEEIADAVAMLLRDRERAAALARCAHAFVDAAYSWNALRPLVHGALAPG